MPESLRTRFDRHYFNMFPAYLGSGGRITYIAGDWHEVRLKIPLGDVLEDRRERAPDLRRLRLQIFEKLFARVASVSLHRVRLVEPVGQKLRNLGRQRCSFLSVWLKRAGHEEQGNRGSSDVPISKDLRSVL